jgi:hypothetical protein
MANLNELQVFLRGGLGNQLFQYSTGLAISEQSGKALVLRTDLLPKTQDQIGGISRWPDQISSFAHSGVVRSCGYQPTGSTNLLGKSMQLMRAMGDLLPKLTSSMGWLASEHSVVNDQLNFGTFDLINSYVPFKTMARENRARLRLETSQIKNPGRRFLELAHDLSEVPTMIVHLRRGDYAHLQKIYGGVSTYFIESAVDKIHNEGNARRTWLFTDSPEGLGSSIYRLLNPSRVIGPSDIASPIENLYLMSRGNAFVASNSTFSWWACLLSETGTKLVAPLFREASVNIFDKGDEMFMNLEIINA